jgi:nitrogen regulatory protein PII
MSYRSPSGRQETVTIMKMVMLVLDDLNELDNVLDAWSDVGVTGVTIFETTGFFRRRARPLGLRFLFSIPQPGDGSFQRGHYTLMAIVPNEETVYRCLEAAESVIGDLDQPNTGIFSAWDAPIVKGLRWQPPAQGDDE